MRLPLMLEPREVRRLAILLIALIAVAGLVNVPWAVTMIRAREQAPKLPFIVSSDRGDGGKLPSEWPSRTPHAKPWLPPDYWEESGAFGCRLINARTGTPDPNDYEFIMEVQWVGWPLPVMEIKQMWWNWDDSALQGPEPDPRPSLMLGGLLLNPLILGGSAWLALIMPWLTFTMLRRRSRWRKGRCMACGYPVGTSDRCSECGASLIKQKSRNA